MPKESKDDRTPASVAMRSSVERTDPMEGIRLPDRFTEAELEEIKKEYGDERPDESPHFFTPLPRPIPRLVPGLSRLVLRRAERVNGVASENHSFQGWSAAASTGIVGRGRREGGRPRTAAIGRAMDVTTGGVAP